MEDYEFPIPTSHLRIELLSQIGKTDHKITFGKLLISVDVPLLDRKGKLRTIRTHPYIILNPTS